MPISQFQFEEMQRRLAQNAGRSAPPENATEGVSREVEDLHYPIIEWCKTQVPAVPYIHARTDKRSTVAEGAPDFVLFWKSYVLLIECKTKVGKLTVMQNAWHSLASLQGFTVRVIRSMKEFRELIQSL